MQFQRALSAHKFFMYFKPKLLSALREYGLEFKEITKAMQYSRSKKSIMYYIHRLKHKNKTKPGSLLPYEAEILKYVEISAR